MKKFIVFTMLVATAFSLSCNDRKLSRRIVVQVVDVDQAPIVDILFVVDNSDSMNDEVAAVQAGISNFIAELENREVDVQIGVTTAVTRSQEGQLLDFEIAGELLAPVGTPAIISDETSDDFSGDLADILDYVQQGEIKDSRGKGCEQHVEAVRLAIDKILSLSSDANGNQTFPREKARLAVIVVTDEDDNSFAGVAESTSDTEACDTTPAGALQLLYEKPLDTLSGYADYFKDYFAPDVTIDLDTGVSTVVDNGSFSINAVLALDGDVESCGFGAAPEEESTALEDFIDEFGGLKASICSTDYDALLGELGEEVAGLVAQIGLDLPAISSTVRVFITPEGGQEAELSTSQFRYSVAKQAVLLNTAPNPGDSIRISYTANSNGLTLTN